MNIRVLLADDHKMMREGLKSLLDKNPDIEVVGEAQNGKDTVGLAHKLGVHVVIMDVAMPDLNGIEATRKIVHANSQTKIIGLSGHADQHLVREMLKAGASGYVLKHTACEDLVRAIREVMKGKTYLSPEITQGVVDTYVRSRPKSGQNPAFAVLTDREREVLQSLSEGKSTKEMADELGVSLKTVETHRRNIMEKLNLHSVAELTKYAIREGITSV
jgi:DNA-binding NarL/FixJ family response regulator